jgi:dTDP-4-dehydrorhamnose reductase
MKRVIVLGASSWLGFLVLNRLKEVAPQMVLAGTVHVQVVNFTFSIQLYKADSIEDYFTAFKAFTPDIIVNFLKSEGESAFQLHRKILEFSKSHNCYYMFASSALALDGYPPQTDLTEDRLAKAKSVYGLHKAACEYELYDFSGRWSIIRFASVQGWVPHRVTRNENFLKKLAVGEMVLVDRGVFQNRMVADLMIDAVVRILEQQVGGIIHFGTVDASEEFEFLKRQAEIFGFSPSLVQSVQDRNINLVTIPKMIYNLFGDDYRCLEKETLQRLTGFVGLARYMHN